MIVLSAPASTFAGEVSALGTLLTAVSLVVAAVSAALVSRRNGRRMDEYQSQTTARLAVIHTLVNSTLTAAKDAELSSTRRELAMMEAWDAERLTAGVPATEDRQAVVGALRRKVDELVLAQADRAAQTRAADIQIATEADRQASA